ncbi:acyl-CoA carboxylase subunit epsilon [Streptomyces sp. NPDC017529]|uniref:acyl-CoA carboxylase subunit epsilon n=1 Tax=Streptomyces sp. NPDC017529 TaxID=3365000 RepID=UPI0037915DE1
MIKVVRGNPTPEELAAALAVVRTRAAAAAAAADAAAPGTDRTDEWADPAFTVPGRRLPHPGPRAWRTSYWPR